MRKISAIIIQIVIFIAAWYLIANRIEANTYFGSVSYNVDVIAENIRWILLGAAGLSMLNIWVWWPKVKEVKVTSIPTEVSPAEDTNTKSEVKDEDPKIPDLS